jgi:hypothetical protein
LWLVSLNGTQVSDETLAELAQLRQVRRIFLDGAQTTSDGIGWLRERLPGCEISADPDAE